MMRKTVEKMDAVTRMNIGVGLASTLTNNRRGIFDFKQSGHMCPLSCLKGGRNVLKSLQ